MAVQLPGKPYHGLVRNGAYIHFQEKKPEIFHSSPGWYLSRKEVEDHSPSRRDGIDFKKETQLRKLYCSFLQDLGMKLKVPQVTIATSMIFCHRFYLRQSHAKNEWQTMSTVCMFLAAKVEETPRLLREVVIVAYELMYKRDPAAAQRIKRKEIYEQQKELVLLGERLLLATIGFDLNVQHPYKPLVAALKKFKIEQNDLAKVAWNFVNDWLRTTLCLQFKPHYIAAGSIFLAAKFHKVKLPLEKGLVWWHEFDVTPRQLEEVIQQMLEVFEQNRRSGAPNECEKPKQSAKVVEKAASNSPQSCALSGSVLTCNSSHAIGREIGRETSANSMYQNSLGSWNLANSDILIAGKCKLQTDKSDWCSRIVSGPVSTCSQSCGTNGQVGGGTSVNLMSQNSLENWNSSYNGIKLTRKEESQSQTSNWHSRMTSGSVLTCNSSHESNRDIREETYANSINSLCNRNQACNGIPVVTEGELQCLSIDWQSSVISRSLSTCNSSYQTDGEMRRHASGNLINQSSVVNQNTAYNATQNTAYNATQNTVEREIQSQASNWHSCVTSGSALTCNSSYEPNRDIGGVTCASLLNQNSIGSQSLACQIDDWDSCAKGRSEITFNSSYGTIREVEGDTANLVSQIALGQQDLAYNDTLLAGRGEMHSQISDCGSTLRVTNVLNSYEKSDEREPEQITVSRDGEETVKLETSDFGCGALSKIDMVRIRATLRKRRGEMKVIKKMDAVHNGDDDDAWIESELENGIVVTSLSEKKQRLV